MPGKRPVAVITGGAKRLGSHLARQLAVEFEVARESDFIFTLTGSTSGTFDVSIVCESDAVCLRSAHIHYLF